MNPLPDQESPLTNLLRRPAILLDSLARSLGSLRLSVTDRCNMRCGYCMPEESYTWLPRESLLSYEEMARLAALFARVGVAKVRVTGGEPLLRHDLHRLVGMLRPIPGIRDIALTTNGLLLGAQAAGLRAAGLDRITLSLDTLVPARLERFARSTRHADILAGLAAAGRAGFTGTKINMVVIRGFNDDEIIPMLEFARPRGAEVRFIEYMDVGGATRWSLENVVSQREILEQVAARYGSVTALPGRASAPAERFQLPDATTFGIIASTTQPFCRDCDRSRVTADGTWLLCLYAENGIDLREPLRNGADDEALLALIRAAWTTRDDRGAERRAEMPGREPLYQLEGLRADPRREMHTRGG